MRVYHFLSAKWALDDIEKQHIRLSKLDELNDPFELWCVSQEDRRLRDSLRKYKDEMTESYGMVCFSRRWSNPLLWSHYADKHRGICLGFDVDERGLKDVIYVVERPNLKIPPTFETSHELLYTKYLDWKYEEELRTWFRLEERDERGNYFYPFDSMVQLREVIVGPLCDTSESTIRRALGAHRETIRVTKARLAFRSFDVVENQQGFRSR